MFRTTVLWAKVNMNDGMTSYDNNYYAPLTVMLHVQSDCPVGQGECE